MAKTVFKIAVNVTPLMLLYIVNFWLCELKNRLRFVYYTIIMQTFLGIATYGFVSV